MRVLRRMLCGGVVTLACTSIVARCDAQAFDPETYRASDVLNEAHSLRPPARIGEANNAGVAYFKAWDMLKLRELQEVASLGSEVDPEGKLKPQLRSFLTSHRDYVDALLAASAMKACDWGPNWDSGWELRLPHLGYLRTSARVLRADARRCGEDGSLIAAAERVRGMLRVSVHASSDPLLISSLVGIAIGSLAVQATDELISREQVTPATAKVLLAAYRAVPREDLYGLRRATERERQTTLEWLTRRCTGDDAGRDYQKLVGEMGMGAPEFDRLLSPVLLMNEQQFQRELQRASRYYDEVIAAWDQPNAWARLQELETELQEFQFGLVAIEMTPAVSKARYSVFDIRKKFARIERRLTEIASAAEGGTAEEPKKESSQTK